jgi:hypothetical protein
MQVSNPTSSFSGNPTSTASSNAAGNGTAASFQSLLGQLTSYVKDTPAQRLEASILGQLGITPEQLQKMTPQEREKVEEKVTELMKKEMQAQQQQQQQQLQAKVQQPASQSNTHSSSGHNTTINLFV